MPETTDLSAGPNGRAGEIVKADRAYRTAVLIAYILIIVLGFVLFKFIVPAGRAYLGTLDWYRLLQTLRWLLILVLVSFAPAAVYLLVVGRRILRHEQWPYPGRKVMFDTTVVRGEEARKRGRRLVRLAVTFLVLMVVVAVYTYFRYTAWLNSPLLGRFWWPDSV
jgi:hypothetical protein